MSQVRRGVRFGLYTLVLAGLVAGTGTVVVAEVRQDDSADSAVLASTSPAPVDDAADGSADVPVRNDLSADDVQHVLPASRSMERDPLVEGVTFTVVVDGVTTEITSSATTLSDALTEAGIALGWEDEVTADLSQAPQAGAEVRIGRASTQYLTEQILTPHATEERKNASILLGEKKVVQEGVDGEEHVTSKVALVDGVEVSRSTVMSVRSSEAVTEIVEVGTRVPTPVATTPAPSSSGSGSSGSGSSGSSGTTAPAPAPAPAAAPADPGTSRGIAKDMVLARGWDEAQWACLDSLWQKESNWNHLAKNKSSGAYGIPQSLPGSKMASVGSDWQTNPATQITWGLNYIEGRYGNPCGAWDHSKRRNWY